MKPCKLTGYLSYFTISTGARRILFHHPRDSASSAMIAMYVCSSSAIHDTPTPAVQVCDKSTRSIFNTMAMFVAQCFADANPKGQQEGFLNSHPRKLTFLQLRKALLGKGKKSTRTSNIFFGGGAPVVGSSRSFSGVFLNNWQANAINQHVKFSTSQLIT